MALETQRFLNFFLGKEALTGGMHACTQLSNKNGQLMENKNLLPLPDFEKSTLQLKLKINAYENTNSRTLYTNTLGKHEGSKSKLQREYKFFSLDLENMEVEGCKIPTAITVL